MVIKVRVYLKVYHLSLICGGNTGKEILSIFLPKGLDIKHKAKSCIGCEKCMKEKCKNDAYVVIKNGKLVHGSIDSAAVGAESGKIIDKIEKQFGPKTASKFIYDITRLAIQSLMLSAFSISISDQDLPDAANEEIKKIISRVRKDVDRMIEDYEHW